MRATLTGPFRLCAFIDFDADVSLAAEGGPALLRLLGPSGQPHDRRLEADDRLRVSRGQAMRVRLGPAANLHVNFPADTPTHAGYFCDNCFAPIARFPLDARDPVGELARLETEFWSRIRDRGCPRCRAVVSAYV